MDPVSITSVKYSGYKGLRDYYLRLTHLNILVGPNNSGKSTILGAFRVLAQGLRQAGSRKAQIIDGPQGPRPGWSLPDEALPISAENIHTNYAEIDTKVDFRLSNGSAVSLFFPEEGGCRLFADSENGYIRRPSDLRRHIPLQLVVVPILGPVEHQERLVSEETVRRNLITTRASRNFRSYWHYRYYEPGEFDHFAALVRQTWPEMDIEPPEQTGEIIVMFCLENRLARELYWSGFGFQIWLQLLTHISRSQGASLIVIDEPELYLHPDAQRQLLGILRDTGPDVLLATHSTEIMSEADPSEILVVDKGKRSAERLKDIEGMQRALNAVGSVQNITLTRLARNRKLLFTEGETDFRLIRRFARKLGYSELAAGTDLTSIESGGFSSWARIRALAGGFQDALGIGLHVGAIFDRDYWCSEEIEEIKEELSRYLQFAHIHSRKEFENYLLVPDVLQRALESAIRERARRTGEANENHVEVRELLNVITEPTRAAVQSQYIDKRVKYFATSRRDGATVTKEAVDIFDSQWKSLDKRMCIVPGKEALAALRTEISEVYKVSLTDHRIVGSFQESEIPTDLVQFLEVLERYRTSPL